jgi:hypothetical protein
MRCVLECLVDIPIGHRKSNDHIVSPIFVEEGSAPFQAFFGIDYYGKRIEIGIDEF